MKRTLFFLILLFVTSNISSAQNRIVARGAEAGELYLSTFWYGIFTPELGPPYYDTLRSAVYRVTENGKKFSIQYDFNLLSPYYPQYEMLPERILADATPGVIYNKNIYYNGSNYITQLWVSFDYGKNWVFREENIGSNGYSSVNVEGIIFRFGADGAYKSEDYGSNFIKTEIKGIGSDPGLQYGEGFGISGNNPYQYSLSHTYNFYETFTKIPIDSQYVAGQMNGYFPDVFRGGLPGEVYVTSWFPDDSYSGGTYIVSFSTDTGYTFRHVYVCDKNCIDWGYLAGSTTLFMSDREKGVFYILRFAEVVDLNPWGLHLKLCIDYYRDYGETLEATFCHDITKNYVYEEVACNNTTSLTSKIENQNSVQLQWTSSANNSLIRGYHVYRDNIRITSKLLTDTIYLDEDLPIGAYNYFIKTYYKEGCTSDSSNHVTETIELGVKELKEFEGVTLFPNPTTGELTINSEQLTINNVEIFDVYGRKLSSNHLISKSSNLQINISHLPAGIYFVQIRTEQGIISKKVVKY